MSHDQPTEPTDVRFTMRALVIVTIVVAVVAAVLGPFFRIVAPEDRTQVAVHWGICLTLAAGWLVYYARTRYLLERRAGRMLAGLPKYSRQFSSDNRWANRLGGAAMIVLGLFNIAVLANDAGNASGIFGAVWSYLVPKLIGSCLVAYGITLVWWHGTVQLRERGALYGLRILRWYCVTNCHWVTYAESRLRLEGIDQRHADIQLEMVVPSADREAIKAVLDERLATSSSPHQLRVDGAPTVAPQPIPIKTPTGISRRGCLAMIAGCVVMGYYVVHLEQVQPPEFAGGAGVGLAVAVAMFRFGYRTKEAGPPRVRLPRRLDWPVLLVWAALAAACDWLSQQVPLGYSWVTAVFGFGFVFAAVSAIVTIPHYDVGLCDDGVLVPQLLAWRWDKVKVRRPDREGLGRLVLSHGWRRVVVNVPREQRAAVDALLEEKLGPSDTSGG